MFFGNIMLLTELERFIEEDIGYNDMSSGIIPDCSAHAEVVVKEEGVISGLAEATQVFDYFEVFAATELGEGSQVKRNDIVFTLEGGARSILRAERLALNFLGRMSGIATMTKNYVDKAEGVRIAGTRKTTPGFRKFEKKAIIAGGGDPHRFNLSDAILIKDNHLAVLGLEKAINAAKDAASFTQKIEVEVEDIDAAIQAAEMNVDIIMFDNIPVDQIEYGIKELVRKGLRDRVMLEASGGITLENISDYARTGVDIISIGALTHSARWLDVSLRMK